MESYDQIVKKLIKIIQIKSDDNVKQLEELWESFEKTCQNELKRPLNIGSVLNNKELENPAKRLKHTINTTDTPMYKSRSINNIEKNSSCSLSTASSNSEKSPDSNDAFDDEMLDLDFNCFVCKKMNQDKNNKLIECNRCSKLYHQKCHFPVIEEKKNSLKYNEENKMNWFIEKCQSCSTITSEEDEKTSMSQNNKDHEKVNKICNNKSVRSDYKKNSKASESSLQENQRNFLNLQSISVKK